MIETRIQEVTKEIADYEQVIEDYSGALDDARRELAELENRCEPDCD